MSKFDSMWNQSQAQAAAQEGWELGLVVDEGRPVSTTYLNIFDKPGSPFKNRNHAYAHVSDRARSFSKLHCDALSACIASRASAQATRRKP